jgi:ABC-type spermidine/putrescine transport system permease subunit I
MFTVLAAFMAVAYGVPFLVLTGMAADVVQHHDELSDLFEPYRLACFWASARRAVIVSLTSIVFGFVIAVSLQGFKERWRNLILVLFTLPFLASDVGRAFALRTVMARHGAINELLIHVGVISEPLDWLLFSEFAISIGQFINAFPFALFIIVLAVRSIDPGLYEVASELGGKFGYVLKNVTLPLCFPAAIGSFLVTFAVGLGAMVEVDFLSSTRCSIGHAITGLWQASRFELSAWAGILVCLASMLLLVISMEVFRRTPAWTKR